MKNLSMDFVPSLNSHDLPPHQVQLNFIWQSNLKVRELILLDESLWIFMTKSCLLFGLCCVHKGTKNTSVNSRVFSGFQQGLGYLYNQQSLNQFSKDTQWACSRALLVPDSFFSWISFIWSVVYCLLKILAQAGKLGLCMQCWRSPFSQHLWGLWYQ